MRVVFVTSVAFLLYTYVFYPLVIALWALLFPRRTQKRYAAVPLSVVLPVGREEGAIEERLRNIADQDYPPDLVEILVVCYDAAGGTAERVRRIGDARIKVIEADGAGKASAVNVGVANASNDVVVFADSRLRFSENVFAELAATLQDHRVGAVSGDVILRRGDASDVRDGVRFFRKYEKFIRRKESEAHSIVGATGPIYAIRRRLFQPLAASARLDDFLVPMRIVLAGFRVIFVRSARAFDWTTDNAAQEFAGRVRMLAGHFQALALERGLLDPRRNRVLFQMVSHNVTRLIAPYFMLLALVSNLFLAEPLFRVTLALQLLFYVALILRFTPLATTPAGSAIRVAWTFAVMNAAAVVALWVFVTGKEGPEPGEERP